MPNPISPTLAKLRDLMDAHEAAGAHMPSRELFKAACKHAMGRVSIAEIAQPLAVMWMFADYLGGVPGWFLRCWVNSWIWYFRRLHPKTKDRPLWNDFEMCRWMLYKDTMFIRAMLEHFERSSNLGVVGSAVWMTNSVAMRDVEFAEQWSAADGPVRLLEHFKKLTAHLSPLQPNLNGGLILVCDSCARRFDDADFDRVREVIPMGVATLTPDWTASLSVWELIAVHAGWITRVELSPNVELSPDAMYACCPACPRPDWLPSEGEAHA